MYTYIYILGATLMWKCPMQRRIPWTFLYRSMTYKWHFYIKGKWSQINYVHLYKHIWCCTNVNASHAAEDNVNIFYTFINVTVRIFIFGEMAVSCWCCMDSQAWGIYHPPTFPTWLPRGNMCLCVNKINQFKNKNLLAWILTSLSIGVGYPPMKQIKKEKSCKITQK